MVVIVVIVIVVVVIVVVLVLVIVILIVIVIVIVMVIVVIVVVVTLEESSIEGLLVHLPDEVQVLHHRLVDALEVLGARHLADDELQQQATAAGDSMQ